MPLDPVPNADTESPPPGGDKPMTEEEEIMAAMRGPVLDELVSDGNNDRALHPSEREPVSTGAEGFMDGLPRFVDEATMQMRWGGSNPGARFRCYLCGHRFVVGEIFRWQYVEGAYSNFFVCRGCDSPKVVQKWKNHVDRLREVAWWLFPVPGDQPA